MSRNAIPPFPIKSPTISDWMKAVSEEEEEEDNDNLERNAVPTVSDWMKAVREPDGAV